MKNRTFLLILFFAISLYLFLFPVRLEEELTFTPQWNLNLETAPFSGDIDGGVPFLVPDVDGELVVGYLSEEGNLLYSTAVYYGAAVHPEGFINYSRAGGDLIIQDPQGRLGERITSDGFPLFRGDRLFTISRDRKGISRWTMEGDLLWSHHFGSLITTLDVQNSGVLIGFLNGDVFFLTPDGEQRIFTRQKIHAIYGCALSPSQELFATVSRLDPQILSVYTFREGDVQLLWTRELEESLPQYRYMRFSDDSRAIYWDSPRGLETVDWMGENHQTLALTSPFKAGAFGKQDELTTIFGADSGGGELLLAEVNRSLRLKIPFQGDAVPVRLDGYRFLFARQGQIFAVERGVR